MTVHFRTVVAFTVASCITLAAFLASKWTVLGARAGDRPPIVISSTTTDTGGESSAQLVPLEAEEASRREAADNGQRRERPTEKELTADGGWLTKRRNTPMVMSNDGRIQTILWTQERYKNADVWAADQLRDAYLLTAYSVATTLDWNGRTAEPDRVQVTGEQRFSSDGANYIFHETEFPLYDELLALRIQALEGQNGMIGPPPIDLETRLDAMVQSALDLLSK